MILVLNRLFRVRLAILNGVAAIGGALFFPAPVDSGQLWGVFSGVCLLAAGGSAINQAMEHDRDRLMIRTSLRPVPQGLLTPRTATLIGLMVSLAGAAVLGLTGGWVPTLLGCGALLWYLAVYTPLKRHTPYALLAGAVCGAIPPVIGWCCAGGWVAEFRVILLAGLLYLWQIPHFWLFQRRYEADYRAAGFPLLSAANSGAVFPGIFGLWIAALTTAAMLLPALGLFSHATALFYALFPLPLLVMTMFRREKALFSYLNYFPLMVTVMIVAQRHYY